jgi:hypothetical protein
LGKTEIQVKLGNNVKDLNNVDHADDNSIGESLLELLKKEEASFI